MFVARKKKAESLVAYLLYMWQIEDIIRAFDCDKTKINEFIISKYQVSDDERNELTVWYEQLIDMMLSEGLRETGHLQINKIVLLELERLHRQLLSNEKEYIYTSLHFQVLPAIIQLKGKTPNSDNLSEIELCLNAVYGYMTLKMKGENISEDTSKSIQQISNLLSMLAHKYNEEKEKEKDGQENEF